MLQTLYELWWNYGGYLIGGIALICIMLIPVIVVLSEFNDNNNKRQ